MIGEDDGGGRWELVVCKSVQCRRQSKPMGMIAFAFACGLPGGGGIRQYIDIEINGAKGE